MPEIYKTSSFDENVSQCCIIWNLNSLLIKTRILVIFYQKLFCEPILKLSRHISRLVAHTVRHGQSTPGRSRPATLLHARRHRVASGAPVARPVNGPNRWRQWSREFGGLGRRRWQTARGGHWSLVCPRTVGPLFARLGLLIPCCWWWWRLVAGNRRDSAGVLCMPMCCL